MRYSIIAALLAVAVSAAPWGTTKESTPTPTSAPANQCSQNQAESCCNAPNGDAVAGLQCTLGLLGGTCSGSVQCCDVNGDGNIIGLNLCVPIQA